MTVLHFTEKTDQKNIKRRRQGGGMQGRGMMGDTRGTEKMSEGKGSKHSLGNNFRSKEVKNKKKKNNSGTRRSAFSRG